MMMTKAKTTTMVETFWVHWVEWPLAAKTRRSCQTNDEATAISLGNHLRKSVGVADVTIKRTLKPGLGKATGDGQFRSEYLSGWEPV
jgi:hypothetical protein